MSTEYFYIKESTKELFDLGNGGHYYDLYELILKKIRSFQKSGTSIDVVKEKDIKKIKRYLDESSPTQQKLLIDYLMEMINFAANLKI